MAVRGINTLAHEIATAGHVVLPVPPDVPDPEATLKIIAAVRPHVLVMDRLANEPDHLRAFQREGIVVSVLDDPGEGRAVADLPINAILRGDGGAYEGEDYLVLPEPAAATRHGVAESAIVFLSFGGYDHGDLAARAVRALGRLKGPVFLSVVVGSHYAHLNALAEALRVHPHPHELLVGLSPGEFSARLRQATVAVVAGGLTMYDAFRHGVPTIVLSQNEHQAAKAKEYTAAGIAIYLGPGSQASEEQILSTVDQLLHDEGHRTTLARRGRVRVDGQGLARVARLLQVVERLEWDSNFFGFPIARLWPVRLTPALGDLAERRCAELGIRCLYFLCDSAHPASAALAEASGFQLVDTRVTLALQFPVAPSRSHGASVPIRSALPADLPALREIAGDAFGQSRFYADPHFTREAASRLYKVWIEKSCAGFAEAVLVAEVGGQAAGFITCHLPSPGRGRIGLVGVEKSHAGHGLGQALVTRAIEWFGARGTDRVDVVTQNRNQQALRLYQGCGFSTARVEHWFHRWFEPRS